jgi:hypothetical protein
MRRRGAASAKQGYGHDEQRTTNNEHAITLTGAELNEVVGGLYPQPLPPGPPPELSRSILSIFRSFGINQHFTFTSVFRPFSF